MNITPTKSLIPYPGPKTVPLNREKEAFALDRYTVRQERGRLFYLRDERKGIYGPHGRQVVYSKGAEHVDLYI